MAGQWCVYALLALVALQVSTTEDVHELNSLDLELIETGVGMRAESLIKQGTTGKQAAMSKEELKARNLVMLGDVATDRAKVEVAQRAIKHVLHHIGRKHPEYLMQTQGMEDFVDNDLLGESDEKLDGGFNKLKKILLKIDDLELELQKELDDEEAKRKKNREDCATEISNMEDEIAEKQQELDDAHAQVSGLKGGNLQAQDDIRASRDNEAGSKAGSYESLTEKNLGELKEKYDEYWSLTDDSAAVRNILMQALWMVCTGFRSFRHVDFCETLRKQPDYAEPPLPQGEAKDGDEAYEAHKKASEKFSHTMEGTWVAQKKADAHAANSGDGDIDMEKGFVNNRAPWGVDPATDGMEKDLTHEEMASRLDFLLQESDMSPKVSSPITGFISALQTGAWDDAKEAARAEAGKETLVDALSGLDREEGTAQHDRDKEWQILTDLIREEVDGNAKSMIIETNLQQEKQQLVFDNEGKMRDINNGVIGHEAEQAVKAKLIKDKMNECEKLEIESDAIIEVAKEELVNVQRLNSLLRFLALGDDPSEECTDTSGGCIENQGMCTWWTRGSQHNPIHGDTNKDKAFCACEYGFYGEKCELRKCKGFGRIRYRADQPGVCSNREVCQADGACNECNTETGLCMCHKRYYMGRWNKCEMKYCPMAVNEMGATVYAESEEDLASECVSPSQGKCNAKRGKCECEVDFWGPHCGYRKCKSADDKGEILAAKYRGTSPNACAGRGACDADTGECNCDGQNYFGDACQFSSCGAGMGAKADQCSGKGACNTLTGLCSCDKGTKGGGCVEGEGCKDCNYKECEANCNGNNGMCDRISGKCVCMTFEDAANSNAYTGRFNGKVCLEPVRKNKYLADWTRSMDKWGWSVCKKGYLLTGLKRDGLGDALYNLGYGVCEQPAEGAGVSPAGIPANDCYHENWWKKFDTKGGKFCRRGYFVSGLFRSHCNSLYCIEMAKCCQVKRSQWNQCKWVKYTEDDTTGEATVESPNFIAGFFRDEKHTLDGITWFRACQPYFYGADYR
jgi:hypothetical protein